MVKIGPVPADFDGFAFASANGLGEFDFYVEGGNLYALRPVAGPLPRVTPATARQVQDAAAVAAINSDDPTATATRAALRLVLARLTQLVAAWNVAAAGGKMAALPPVAAWEELVATGIPAVIRGEQRPAAANGTGVL